MSIQEIEEMMNEAVVFEYVIHTTSKQIEEAIEEYKNSNSIQY